MSLYFYTYLSLIIAAVAVLAGLRPGWTRWRWQVCKQAALAQWSHLPLGAKQHAVALAWGFCEQPRLAEADLLALLDQALERRWQAMQRPAQHRFAGVDLVAFEADMAELLQNAASGH